MKGLTDIPGIRVGHVSDFDAITGCTAILCEQGAVGGVDIRGSASGTEEIDTLSPGHVTDRCTASCWPAAALSDWKPRRACAAIWSRKVGYDFGGQHIPIVPGAILFDLGIGKPNVHPNVAMGEAAAAAATTDAVKEGCVGAGTGATVGKLFGMAQAMKSGIGSYTVTLPGGVMVSAPGRRQRLRRRARPGHRRRSSPARARRAGSREFVDTRSEMKRGAVDRRRPQEYHARGGRPPMPGSIKCRPTNWRSSPPSAWRAPFIR